jgi:hypothetical protein
MRLRSSSSFFFVLSLAGWALAGPASAPVTREDDANHFASFAGGEHEGDFAEWWYFNLVDPDHGVQAIFAYSVIDPTNRTRLGMASVLAVVYAAGGPYRRARTCRPTRSPGPRSRPT